MPELTARILAFTPLVAPTIAAVLAATVLLARQNDNAPIRIIAPTGDPVAAGEYVPALSSVQTEDLIDLNSASASLLDTLPGIGPALAGAIIDYRETVHPFRSVAEVQEVSRIGPETYENIRDLVTVSEEK